MSKHSDEVLTHVQQAAQAAVEPRPQEGTPTQMAGILDDLEAIKTVRTPGSLSRPPVQPVAEPKKERAEAKT